MSAITDRSSFIFQRWWGLWRTRSVKDCLAHLRRGPVAVGWQRPRHTSAPKGNSSANCSPKPGISLHFSLCYYMTSLSTGESDWGVIPPYPVRGGLENKEVKGNQVRMVSLRCLIFSLEIRQCSPTMAWLGQVCFGGTKEVSEPCSAGGRKQPFCGKPWGYPWVDLVRGCGRGAGNQRSNCPVWVVRNRWRLLKALLPPRSLAAI